MRRGLSAGCLNRPADIVGLCDPVGDQQEYDPGGNRHQYGLLAEDCQS